jgi:hypothetical protein
LNSLKFCGKPIPQSTHINQYPFISNWYTHKNLQFVQVIFDDFQRHLPTPKYQFSTNVQQYALLYISMIIGKALLFLLYITVLYMHSNSRRAGTHCVSQNWSSIYLHNIAIVLVLIWSWGEVYIYI